MESNTKRLLTDLTLVMSSVDCQKYFSPLVLLKIQWRVAKTRQYLDHELEGLHFFILWAFITSTTSSLKQPRLKSCKAMSPPFNQRGELGKETLKLHILYAFSSALSNLNETASRLIVSFRNDLKYFTLKSNCLTSGNNFAMSFTALKILVEQGMKLKKKNDHFKLQFY